MSNSVFLLTPDTHTAFTRFREHLQAIEPLALVWLVMPGSLARVWRLQATSSLNVHVVTLGQLAYALLRSTGHSPPLLDSRRRTRRLAHLMEQAHAERRLKVLPPPSQTPNLARHVDALIQELKQAEISVAAFQAEAVRTGQKRDRELAYLYDQYEAILAMEDLCDSAGVMTQVCHRAEEIWTTLGPPAYVGIAGHDWFSTLEARFLDVIRKKADRFEIHYPAGTDRSTWHLAAKTASALGLTCPEPVLESGQIGQTTVMHVEAPTPEHEVRHVLRQIKRQHLDTAIPLRDFTICLPDLATYEPLLNSCAEEYGVPLALARSVALHPLAQTLWQLLHLASDFPWHLCWDVLASPFVHQAFLGPADLRDLRQITQRGQVVEGLVQWETALDWGASRAGPDGLSPERIASLRTKSRAFFAACRPPESKSAHACLDWIANLLPEEGEGSLHLVLPDCNDLQERILGQGVWIQIQKAIQALKSDMAPQTASAWTDVRTWFWDTLQDRKLQIHELSRAVQVTSFADGWSQPAPYLYVLGLNEGVLPRIPNAGPLYSLQERQESPLPLPLYDARQASLRWTQLIANCTAHVHLSRSTSDGEMRDITASAFWVPATEPRSLSRSLIPPCTEAASLMELATALQDQQRDTSSERLQGILRRAQEMASIVTSRLSSRGPVGPFEGHLAHRAIRSELQRRFDRDTIWSASSLQDYARCPMGFLAKRILELQPETQAATELDFMTRGLVLHDILNRLWRWARNSQIELSEANADSIFAKARECIREAWANLQDRYLLQPYALDKFDLRQIENLVLRALQLDLADTEWRPFQLEWRFGDRNPAEVTLRHKGDDWILPLHGIVDRIDRSETGQLRVVDYKSRSKTYSEKDMNAALNTQTVLYALVVNQQGWGPVVTSGFRMLHNTEKGALQNQIDWTAESPRFVSEVMAALCRQQDDMRFGRFPAAPSKFVETNDRCTEWCALAEFCQPSPQSRRKAERAFVR